MGLKSVRERLQLQFGSDAELIVHGSIDGRVISTIQIPLTAKLGI
jgi:sensor histidine kinase YesM